MKPSQIWGFLRRACRAFLRPVNSNTGWRVLNVGGNWNNTDNAGLFYFNANNTATNSNTNYGARPLVISSLLCVGLPSPLGENIANRTGFSRLILEIPRRQTRTGGEPVPKRVGYLYEAMLNKSLIRVAIQSGAKGKHDRWDVKPVMADVDGYVDKIYDMIAADAYVPTKPDEKVIFDQCGQKNRTIQVVPFFPDGIMHQLIVLVMQPVLMRGMYHWSCASIPGRGAHHAVKKVKRIMWRDPKGAKYVCKFDIKQFYPSISHKKLIWALARKIKDKKFLKLVYDVLETCPVGLAIGYFVCQWLANFYLETLDHYITTLPGVKYMVRYMDDVVLFGPNKKQLHKARKAIEQFMREKLGLRMKENWQVFPIKARMLDFVGFRFDRNHVIMRRRNFLRFARQCRRAEKKIKQGKRVSFKLAAGLLSRAGQLRHCDSHMIRTKYLDPVGIKNLKEVVRNESKRRSAAQQRLYTGGAA